MTSLKCFQSFIHFVTSYQNDNYKRSLVENDLLKNLEQKLALHLYNTLTQKR